MRITHLVIFLLACVHAEGCWFRSKDSSLNRIKSYMRKIGKKVSHGLDRKDLNDVIRTAPAGVAWAIKKVSGVEGVLKDCDTNHDGVIHFAEAKSSTHCLESCWKQSAILTFL